MPTFLPWIEAPWAWAQSSITISPCSLAKSLTWSISEGKPQECMAMMARVLRRDRLPGMFHVDGGRAGVDVDEHGNEAEEPHRRDGPEELVAGHHDLRARRQLVAEREVIGLHRTGAVAVALAERHLVVGLPLLFQLGQVVVDLLGVEVHGRLERLLLGVSVLRPLVNRRPLLQRHGHGGLAAVDGQDLGTGVDRLRRGRPYHGHSGRDGAG